MRELELLAPAGNADIGIAAIDCGADAVYIAGEDFGARKAAGNCTEDIARLCDYAHRFGAKVYVTLNTILTDDELARAEALVREVEKAGADALIVQDLAVTRFGSTLPLHASTQCAIRTPEDAIFYRDAGFSRLILERQLSLEEIAEISRASGCETEVFVHGALCVCYSGQCYMSESICGRSANRGECIQACRSRYDLTDGAGRVLVRDKALLSLKDLDLSGRLGDLAAAGACSFKIEGRLKNVSYVRNTVRKYSIALDRLVSAHPSEYVRSSFGTVSGGFVPDVNKTFNRGFTDLFIDGKKEGWSSADAPKSMGEYLGVVSSVRDDGPFTVITVRGASRGRMSQCGLSGSASRGGTSQGSASQGGASRGGLSGGQGRPFELSNGDGFAFTSDREIYGFRGERCSGSEIRARIQDPGTRRNLTPGTRIYRNISAAFEKELDNNLPQRTIDAAVTLSFRDGLMVASVCTEDGRKVSVERSVPSEAAMNQERMIQIAQSQISKKSSIFRFRLAGTDAPEGLPLLSASFLNQVRRDLSGKLDDLPPAKTWAEVAQAAPPEGSTKLASGDVRTARQDPVWKGQAGYKANISNHIAREIYAGAGATSIQPAFETAHQEDAELMRTRHCIRKMTGMCLRDDPGAASGPLYLVNQGRRYLLGFDCAACEMTVKLSRK